MVTKLSSLNSSSIAGYTGSRGYDGSVGYTGSRGTDGVIGYNGSVGYTGSQGAGFTGSQGYDGSVGYTGSRGTDGVIGYNGSVGYTGSQGAGFTGSRGYDGSVGYTGSIGSYTLPRVVSLTDATSVTFNADTTDIATQTNTQAVGTLTINAPTGTPNNGQKILFRLQSTNVQTFSYNAIFASSTDLTLPTASTGSSKYDYMGFIYNSTAAKWQILGKNFGF